MKTVGEARSRILYQLFRTFNDAQNQKLSITKGDLDYYRQIATVDTDPGIATGILSLLFSDTDPSRALNQKDQEASRYFNRAAAYRIFLAYKKDNATTPELAQMYLDIVRLYTSTEQIDIAKQSLDEFSVRYKQTNDFRVVALKLADSYSELKQVDKTRELYREILVSYEGQNIEPNDNHARPNTGPAGKVKDAFSDRFQSVTYGQVLELLVDSLAKDKRTAEIIEVYSNQISKHADAEWLYEARLNWLDQTNLTDDQLAAYKQALDKFQTSSWRDKLARWFLRKDRGADFEKFSTDVVSRLDEAETQDYLAGFTTETRPLRTLKRLLPEAVPVGTGAVSAQRDIRYRTAEVSTRQQARRRLAKTRRDLLFRNAGGQKALHLPPRRKA
jgi:tetratricopeptide (TPR) repeat protein